MSEITVRRDAGFFGRKDTKTTAFVGISTGTVSVRIYADNVLAWTTLVDDKRNFIQEAPPVGHPDGDLLRAATVRVLMGLDPTEGT